MEQLPLSPVEIAEPWEPLSSAGTAEPLLPLLTILAELRYLIFKRLLWTQHLITHSANPTYKRNQGRLTRLQNINHQLRDEIHDWLWGATGTVGLLSRDCIRFLTIPARFLIIVLICRR